MRLGFPASGAQTDLVLVRPRPGSVHARGLESGECDLFLCRNQLTGENTGLKWLQLPEAL